MAAKDDHQSENNLDHVIRDMELPPIAESPAWVSQCNETWPLIQDGSQNGRQSEYDLDHVTHDIELPLIARSPTWFSQL